MLLSLLHRAILVCLLLSGISPAQAFLFASPNTRDHLSDKDAADSFTSFEQSNFLAVATFLAAKLCVAPHVFSTEGIYEGSAENSSLVTGCKNDQAEYMGELLGRYAHQKQVLVFDASSAPDNHERLITIEFAGDQIAETVKHLRQAHITGAAVLPRGQVIQVYVWVTDHSQDAALHAFANAEHGSLREIPGKGTLIGSEDRTAAQREFDQRIHAYERAHHRSFSKLLWSKQFHDMVVAGAPR